MSRLPVMVGLIYSGVFFIVRLPATKAKWAEIGKAHYELNSLEHSHLIKVHHLEFSRSSRVLWLLEEIGIAYEMAVYQRDPLTMLAPAALKEVHELGKAPVIEDGKLVLAESGAIIEYLAATYGKGRLGPASSEPDWPDYISWLHFAEGSAMAALVLSVLGGRGGLPAPLQAYADNTTSNALDHIERRLEGRHFLVGNELTGADIQIFYVIDFAIRMNRLSDRPLMREYYTRLSQRPAYIRAIEKGGPMALPLRNPGATRKEKVNKDAS